MVTIRGGSTDSTYDSVSAMQSMLGWSSLERKGRHRINHAVKDY